VCYASSFGSLATLISRCSCRRIRIDGRTAAEYDDNKHAIAQDWREYIGRYE